MTRFLWLLGFLIFIPHAFAGDNNVKISGALVSEPCTLSEASSDIQLDFGNLVSTFFYNSNRTPGEPFSITLVNCDTTLGSSATVTFKGSESVALPGLLTPDAGDTQGIAIGIETNSADPQQLALNKPSPVFSLTSGNNVIALKGYVQAEPAAIAAHSITAGAFTATATFEIAYP
ncbi:MULTISPECIES: fimbrial protein [Enterobacter]|uniref:fimbrial protein n=1 Tax=Enterobacter TaxID=547 RepID=UPI0023010859|nr:MULTISPECIES: fimbrial protein [Enterobacter]MDA5604290.1 fimbrial protein [Enterobacter sp. PI-10]MDO2449530.1 fimbrial protein [Enterobacter vonholyi]